jgi:hypothetical protein
MYRGAMYRKPKYGQNDIVWVEWQAEQPLEGQVLRYLGGATYEVAISGQGREGGPGAGIVPAQQRREGLTTRSFRRIKRL